MSNPRIYKLIGGPHDGLYWNGPADPTIIMERDGRHAVYHLGEDGRYHYGHTDEPGLFNEDEAEE